MNNTQYEEYKMPKLMYLPLQGEDAMTEVDSGLENGDLFVLNGLMTERGKTCVSNPHAISFPCYGGFQFLLSTC